MREGTRPAFGDARSVLRFAASAASDRALNRAAFRRGFLAAALPATASTIIAARLQRRRPQR